MQADPTFTNAGVKVGARVVAGSIDAIPAERSMRFQVTDGSKIVPVIYRGIAPDTFTDSVDVVVGGRMGSDGTFQATELLAKCASRYENAPEKYKETPGYKAGSATRVILIGELSLWVALLMAAWSTTVSYAGRRLASLRPDRQWCRDSTPRSR
jgi:cytochrome c-type biogenesis protein CcmE